MRSRKGFVKLNDNLTYRRSGWSEGRNDRSDWNARGQVQRFIRGLSNDMGVTPIANLGAQA